MSLLGLRSRWMWFLAAWVALIAAGPASAQLVDTTSRLRQGSPDPQFAEPWLFQFNFNGPQVRLGMNLNPARGLNQVPSYQNLIHSDVQNFRRTPYEPIEPRRLRYPWDRVLSNVLGSNLTRSNVGLYAGAFENKQLRKSLGAYYGLDADLLLDFNRSGKVNHNDLLAFVEHLEESESNNPALPALKWYLGWEDNGPPALKKDFPGLNGAAIPASLSAALPGALSGAEGLSLATTSLGSAAGLSVDALSSGTAMVVPEPTAAALLLGAGALLMGRRRRARS